MPETIVFERDTETDDFDDLLKDLGKTSWQEDVQALKDRDEAFDRECAANPMEPGTAVRFTTWYEIPFTYGTIVEHVPSKKGYLVRPDGETEAYGWGYCEVAELAPPTAWERIMGDDL